MKDNQGLGITIAGYTCEREELSGIFDKSVTEGSAADRSGMFSVNDQIVEVDGQSLQGYSNQQAVEMLRIGQQCEMEVEVSSIKCNGDREDSMSWETMTIRPWGI